MGSIGEDETTPELPIARGIPNRTASSNMVHPGNTGAACPSGAGRFCKKHCVQGFVTLST